jgi:hypothetical protein
VPNQPTQEQLDADPFLSRFTIVSDREGYSPHFFAQMKEERIAVLTYHKFPGELWPEQEFRPYQISLVNGEQVSMEMAERGVKLSNDLWVREVRHRSEKGHQSSILSTDYRSDLTRVAVAMFARWCQENFFKYMRQHYNLDRLIEYGTEAIPDTTRAINPAWRQLDSQIRRQHGLLSRELVQFAETQLPQELEPQQVEAYEAKKAQLQQASTAAGLNCNRPLENAANKSSNSKLNAKRFPSTSRSKICLSKIVLVGCVQRKSTSSTRSNSSLIGLKQPSRSLPARRSNASMRLAH